MKKSPLVLLALLALTPALSAQAPGGAAPAPKTLTAAEKAAIEKAKAAAKNAPAGKTAPDPKAKAKKEEPPAKIEGMEIKRGDRGFLGLQIVNSTFKLSFYDAKKKPMAPDVANAAFRWNVNYQKAPERTLLTPSGNALVSEKTIRPPHNFKIFVTLFKQTGGGAEDANAGAENFTVDFTQ